MRHRMVIERKQGATFGQRRNEAGALPSRLACVLYAFTAGFGLGALYMSWAVG